MPGKMRIFVKIYYLMERLVISLFLFLSAASALFGQDITSEQNASNKLPEGIMTLDAWTGRLSINGMNIDKKSTYLYLTQSHRPCIKAVMRCPPLARS